MRNERLANNNPQELNAAALLNLLMISRKTMIGLLLVVALLAFEIFNFDTTRYALQNLLGEVHFLGLGWPSILAVAFCAMDFAGLARLFTPERNQQEPNSVWYLMGAWLLGATMNAIMTWWAISLTLLNHEFGNEVLSREQLLYYVPIFIAALVWLTRILFIGAFSVAGEYLFDFVPQRPVSRQPAKEEPTAVVPRAPVRAPQPMAVAELPEPAPVSPPQPRIRRTEPRPAIVRPRPAGMQARGPNDR